MIAVALLAIVFPVFSLYDAWKQRHIERKFPEFRQLERLRALNNDEQLTTVKNQFANLKFVNEQEFRSIFPNRRIEPYDQFCIVPIDLNSAQWMHFRNDKLVNFVSPAMSVLTEADVLNLARPPWQIRFGQWFVYLFILGIAFTFAFLGSRESNMSANVG